MTDADQILAEKIQTAIAFALKAAGKEIPLYSVRMICAKAAIDVFKEPDHVDEGTMEGMPPSHEILKHKFPLEYTIRPGDTLSHIALKFYGDEMMFGKIQAANFRTIKAAQKMRGYTVENDMSMIYPGTKITIPD